MLPDSEFIYGAVAHHSSKDGVSVVKPTMEE